MQHLSAISLSMNEDSVGAEHEIRLARRSNPSITEPFTIDSRKKFSKTEDHERPRGRVEAGGRGEGGVEPV